MVFSIPFRVTNRAGSQSADSGGLLAFLLLTVVEENKAQRKQAKRQRILFRLWDDVSGNSYGNRASGVPCKIGRSLFVVIISLSKVSNGFVQNAVAVPSKHAVRGILQIQWKVANPNLVSRRCRS